MTNFDKIISYGPLALANFMADEILPYVLGVVKTRWFKLGLRLTDEDKEEYRKSAIKTYYDYLMSTDDANSSCSTMTRFNKLIQSGLPKLAEFIAFEVVQHMLDEFDTSGISMSYDSMVKFRNDIVEKYYRFLMRDEEYEMFEEQKRQLRAIANKVHDEANRAKKMSSSKAPVKVSEQNAKAYNRFDIPYVEVDQGEFTRRVYLW